jgi:hypothetical protein
LKVKNINGIEIEACRCGTWLAHWLKFSKAKQAGLCKELTCKEFAVHGALVQKGHSREKGWYVVPLCDRHNKMTGMKIDLLGKPELVAADVHDKSGAIVLVDANKSTEVMRDAKLNPD